MISATYLGVVKEGNGGIGGSLHLPPSIRKATVLGAGVGGAHSHDLSFCLLLCRSNHMHGRCWKLVQLIRLEAAGIWD